MGLSRLLTLVGARLQPVRNRPKVTILENKVALSAFVVLNGHAQIKFVLHDQQPTVGLEEQDGNIGMPVFRRGGRLTRVEHTDLTNIAASPKIA